MLAVRQFGSGPPVVALHGFTLTGAQFATSPNDLHRCVIAPDLPGHGASAPATLTETIDAVADVVDSAGAPVPLLGYSQGGRIALLVALNFPHLISQLVLISATAGIEAESEKSTRAEADRKLAARIASMTLNAFLDEWTTQGVAATTYPNAAVAAADRSVRAENTAEGLANALIELGQGSQPSGWDRLASLSMPVLAVHGERDTKYASIADRMARSIPDCTVVSIDRAGHNPLIEDHDATYAAISRFLDRTG